MPRNVFGTCNELICHTADPATRTVSAETQWTGRDHWSWQEIFGRPGTLIAAIRPRRIVTERMGDVAERMAHRLAARRRREFVGRAEELGLLARLLTGPDTGGVVFVHGPGGVGKSTLLRQFEWIGVDAGRRVVRLDARDLTPIASSVLAELARQAGSGQRDDPLEALSELAGLLILIDTAELLAPLDRWIREELLPALRVDAITVIAGRTPPALAWRTDPGWRGLVHTIRLDNLTGDESRQLLLERGVPEHRLPDALAFTRGHPLALALVADVVAQGADTFEPTEMPGVVAALLASLVDTVPSQRHRSALEACAQVLSTTEPLLAALLGLEDAREMFDWLRGLSIIEAGPRGLYPHDVARDALGAELRWRHPEQYAEIHRRAGAYYRDLFYGVPVETQQQVLVEYVFLHRDNPVLGPFVSGTADTGTDLRSLEAASPTDAERELARDIVARHEGPEAAQLLDYWTARQPGALLVVRGPDRGVLGLILTLRFAQIGPDDRVRDVAIGRVGAFLDRRPELPSGRVATVFRFWMQRDEYQALGPVQLFITLHFVRTYMSTPGLAYSFVYYAEPGLWADICAYADMNRLDGGDYLVGGRAYGMYWHDWIQTPPLAWLERLGEREIARKPLEIATDAPQPRPIPARLSDGEFAAAVKQALRGISRADGLWTSPLLHSPIVAADVDPSADDRARSDALRARIRQAAALMEASPRDRRAFRALHHTYLQPAATQADAADLLGLPMSTYRRHLAEGIDRITEILRRDDLTLH